MFKTYLNIIVSLLLIIVISCDSNRDGQPELCNKDEIFSPKLISVTEAAELLSSNDFLVPVEISKASEYQSGHLTNAINVWRPDFRSKIFSTYPGMVCNAEELEAFMQELGVSANTQLLLYDNKGGCDAMRLSWVFDCYGISNYKVLNGGKYAWSQAGYPLDTADYQPVTNLEFNIDVSLDSSLYATLDEVLMGINDPNTIIIDTREPYEYRGEPYIASGKVWSHKKGAFERGSIPGAVHLNWSDLSDLANDHRIKCAKDLIYNLKAKGISKEKKIIVYCQSGSRSSHTAFILREILQYSDVKNYDGSWIEWSYYHKQDNKVPIVQHTDQVTFDKMVVKLTNDLNINNE